MSKKLPGEKRGTRGRGGKRKAILGQADATKDFLLQKLLLGFAQNEGDIIGIKQMLAGNMLALNSLVELLKKKELITAEELKNSSKEVTELMMRKSEEMKEEAKKRGQAEEKSQAPPLFPKGIEVPPLKL